MTLVRSFSIIFFILFLSCNNSNERGGKVNEFKKRKDYLTDSIKRIGKLNDSLILTNRIISAQNDSLKKVITTYLFFQDSCIFYGQLGVVYSGLGRPTIDGEPASTKTKKDYLKNRIFKIVFYPTRKDSPPKTVIVDEDNDFKYEVKLKKKSGFGIELFSKKKGKKKFNPEKQQTIPPGFQTTNKDSIEYDIKKLVWI